METQNRYDESAIPVIIHNSNILSFRFFGILQPYISTFDITAAFVAVFIAFYAFFLHYYPPTFTSITSNDDLQFS